MSSTHKNTCESPLEKSFFNRCSENSVEGRNNCFICEIGLLFTKKESICRNMEPPTDSGRRGSGISLSINRGPASQNQRAKHQDYYAPMPHGYPSPYFMQAPPYPVLMNPPPLPTVSFWIIIIIDWPSHLCFWNLVPIWHSTISLPNGSSRPRNVWQTISIYP